MSGFTEASGSWLPPRRTAARMRHTRRRGMEDHRYSIELGNEGLCHRCGSIGHSITMEITLDYGLYCDRQVISEAFSDETIYIYSIRCCWVRRRVPGGLRQERNG